MMVALALMGILAAIATRSSASIMTHSRVNRATSVVAADLASAFALAERERKPIRVRRDNATTYSIRDRVTDSVYTKRDLGSSSEYNLSVAFSQSPVDVFPNGFASSALTVTLTSLSYVRTVTMTRAGAIRVP
jgi:Tfp pilus assembly protein PilE